MKLCILTSAKEILKSEAKTGTMLPVFAAVVVHTQQITLLSVLSVMILLKFSVTASSQNNVALRTNLLYWATTTPNVGIDVGLGKHWSLSAAFGYNAWNFPQRYDAEGTALNPKLHHWLMMPELRYRFGDDTDGHFIGLHLFGGRYNVGGMKFPKFLDGRRYDGWGSGAGIGYGFRWRLGNRWGLEASLGVGYIYLTYGKFRCGACGDREGSYRRHYVGPTKAALSIVYYLDGRNNPVVADDDIPVPVLPPVPDTDPCVDSIAVQLATISDIRDALADAREALDEARRPTGTTTVSMVFAYPLNGDRIEPGIGDNARQLARADSLMQAVLAGDVTPSRIRISGHTSPEAEWEYNKALSTRRAIALRDYITSRYPLAGIPLYLEGGGEDWPGLRSMVVQRQDVPMRWKVIEIIDNIPVKEGREKALMDLGGGEPYRWLMKHVFPQLRRVDLTVEYEN